MGVSRRTATRRVVTVLAVTILSVLGWSGAAWAQATTPTVPVPTNITPSSSISTTTTTGTTTRTSGSALGLPGLGGLFPTGTTGLPSIPGLPSIDPSSSPSVACAQVVSALRGLDPSELSAALDSPAAIFCQSLGFTLPSLPGGDQSATGATETVFAPPDFYDDGYGRHYYGSCGCKDSNGSTAYETPVAATQVSSVPTGGVNTGDGSYEGP